MHATALVYSSHNCSNYIHNDWIVQRALNGNHTLLFLPMSEMEFRGDEYGSQHFGWSKFEWYFDSYRPYGLNAFPFYWSEGLGKEDVDLLFHYLWNAEVVLLGGGNPATGLRRYRELGEQFYGDWDKFGRILHERQERGLLTVGFSAGVDQLCHYTTSAIYDGEEPHGFGLCRNIIASSHYEHGREEVLYEGASKFGKCFVFGLPNDSGLAVDQGLLPSGNVWQVIHFITDQSWDLPRDQWHIKTRQGVNIKHVYPDGREWGFNGGDTVVRIQSLDGNYNDAYIIPVDGPILDYWHQSPTGYSSIEEILATH